MGFYLNKLSGTKVPSPKRLRRTVTAAIATISVGFGGFLVPTASAEEKSAYSDGIGRNEIGPETLEKLKPEVVGGNQSVSVGDAVTYKYTVKRPASRRTRTM